MAMAKGDETRWRKAEHIRHKIETMNHQHMHNFHRILGRCDTIFECQQCALANGLSSSPNWRQCVARTHHATISGWIEEPFRVIWMATRWKEQEIIIA